MFKSTGARTLRGRPNRMVEINGGGNGLWSVGRIYKIPDTVARSSASIQTRDNSPTLVQSQAPAFRRPQHCARWSHRPPYGASANRRRQQGHSPSNPWTRAANADGCGSVMIALNANGARCA